MASFEFANSWVPTNSIDIPEIGNFCLEGIDEDQGLHYFLHVRTTMGTASIVWYGPIVPDIELLPSGYQAKFERLKFKDKEMFNWINKWLNDRIKKISSARLIEESTFQENFRDLSSYIDAYSNEVY